VLEDSGVRWLGPSRRAAGTFGVAGCGLCYRHCLLVLATFLISITGAVAGSGGQRLFRVI